MLPGWHGWEEEANGGEKGSVDSSPAVQDCLDSVN